MFCYFKANEKRHEKLENCASWQHDFLALTGTVIIKDHFTFLVIAIESLSLKSAS